MITQFRKPCCTAKGTPRCAEILIALMKNAYERIVIVDDKNKILFMNRYIENRDPHEVVGENITDVVPDPKVPIALMNKARKENRVITGVIKAMEGRGLTRRIKMVPLSGGWILSVTLPNDREELTRRERQINALGSMSIKEMAQRLCLSCSTIASHRKAIKRKLAP